MSRILINGARGYVGSALMAYLSNAGHEIVAVDVAGDHDDAVNYLMDYRDIGPGHVQHVESAVDVVIHLAGHSSVAACEADPWGSVTNNVTDFLPFVKMLAGLDKPPLLLWASSGSVLSDVHSLYDEQKRALEALIPRLYPRSIGLRFASVCGISPNMRHDIILNAMVKSAVETGAINMANPLVYKPILGLKNLCACVEHMIIAEERWRGHGGEHGTYLGEPTVDLCSFITNPEQAAHAVKEQTGATINRLPRSQAYEFRMSPWIKAPETLDSIVAELVEFYRARVGAEERHRV